MGNSARDAFQVVNRAYREMVLKRGKSTVRQLLQRLTFLAFVAALATASGQSLTWNPLIEPPLEKYDMPPAYIYRLERSPRMISPHGAFTSYQVNVDADGNNIVGDAANEPSIIAAPKGATK